MSQNLTTLLQQLVRIPSVNPDNDPGTSRTGEREIAVFLSGWLESIGAEVTLEEIRPGRPNLIARFAPEDGVIRFRGCAPPIVSLSRTGQPSE